MLALTGITPEVSIILLFTFYQPVVYPTYDQNFPSESEERAGYCVGFGENCGDAMAHKILDHDTQKKSIEVLLDPRSLPLPTISLHHMEGRFPHLLTLLKKNFLWITTWRHRRFLIEPEGPTVFNMSRDEDNPSGSKPMPTFNPSDLIGRIFLLPPEENGERHRAKVTRQVVEIIVQDNGQRVENINFILDIGNGKVEELI